MQEPAQEESRSDLKDRRVLIVEDSPVIAEDTEQMLEEIGCFVVGPATTLADGRQLAEKEQIDAAIVDVNIRGGKAFPVLRILEDRGIPFLLTSGYADWSLPDEWQDRPRVQKPYNPVILREKLIELVSEQGEGAG